MNPVRGAHVCSLAFAGLACASLSLSCVESTGTLGEFDRIIDGDVEISTHEEAQDLLDGDCIRIRGRLVVHADRDIELPGVCQVDGALFVNLEGHNVTFSSLASCGSLSASSCVLNADRCAGHGALLLPALQHSEYLGVSGDVAFDVRAPQLSSIARSLILRSSLSASEIDLSALEEVGEMVELEGDAMIKLDNLRMVGADFTAALSSFAIPPRLTLVVGDFSISGPTPEDLEGPSLREVGAIRIEDVDLALLSLPELQLTAGVFDVGQSAIRAIEVPLLSEVGGAFAVDEVDLLSRLEAPELVGVGSQEDGAVFIARNPSLTSIAFTKLVEVSGPVRVFENDLLPDCEAAAAFPSLEDRVEVGVEVRNNAPCD